MRKVPVLCLVGGVVLSAAAGAMGALTVTVSAEADTFVAELMGSATGLSADTAAFAGAGGAAGCFTGGSVSGIGIESGVILTSGGADLAEGLNSHDSSSVVHGLPGDAALSNLAAGEATNDSAVLEFDISSGGGKLQIRYVFASEEYNEFVHSGHGDIMGIFLDGANIAVVPGTDDPVSVDNVNGGGPVLGTDPSYPAFFHNNDLQDGGPFYDFAYDGFTDVFVSEVAALSPGSHHLRFAIADVGDFYGDSALLIEPFAFAPISSDSSTAPATVPVPGALGMALLGSLLIRARRRVR